MSDEIKTEEKKREPTVKEMFQTLTEAIGALTEKVTEALVNRPAATNPTSSGRTLDQQSAAPVSNGVPIPLSWRDIVDTTLNREFGVEVSYMTDVPKFQFTIVVPERYSNMRPQEKEMYGNIDRRPIVLDNAVGENGIRMWAERVFKNLGPEMQAMIVNDRVTRM